MSQSDLTGWSDNAGTHNVENHARNHNACHKHNFSIFSIPGASSSEMFQGMFQCVGWEIAV